MDLAKLNLTEHANQGATMEVFHPITNEKLLDNNGYPVTITMLGADSTKMRQAMSDRAKRQLSKKQQQIQSIDDAEKLSAELLATITIAWSGMTENGESIECNAENAVRLYTQYSWLRQQVDAFTTDRANFYTA
jgi:hypothetical protein